MNMCPRQAPSPVELHLDGLSRSDVSFFFFFSSRRRHTSSLCDWSSDVCSSDLSLVAHVASPRAARCRETSGWAGATIAERSEERRVGKECRSRWSSYHEKKKRRRKILDFAM